LLDRSSDIVAGYYTLSQAGINLVDLPIEITKKLPKYPVVPATLLGRLAVDKKYQGKGLGEILLMDALQKSLQNEIASMAVVVDAKDDNARSFYEHYQFIRFPDYPNRLFLPMTTIAKMFE
jgi:predicted GNAT family N-acyltransferase